MNNVKKGIICFLCGYALIMTMSLTMPKIMWLRVGLLGLLMTGSILVYLFWTRPKRLWEAAMWLSLSLGPIAEILSLVRHLVFFHDLTIYSATFPLLFGLSLPYFCAGLYQIFIRIKENPV
jgi:hypothetical protein